MGAMSWRFDAKHYTANRGGRDLGGLPVAASWDAELMPAMMRVGKAIHEEQLLDELLSDLAGDSSLVR
jgi:hypothetical protein